MLSQLVTDRARNFRFLETKLIALADSTKLGMNDNMTRSSSCLVVHCTIVSRASVM